jgi:tRNA(Ile)-lysidine synthetase-like protein
MPTHPTHEVCDLLAARLAHDLVIRAVRPGDRVRASERGSRKVQDLMVDARIPAPCRATWPLIESAGRIVWVPGLARDEDFVATEVGAERVRLHWRHLDVA